MSLRRFVPVLFVLGLCAAGLHAQQQFTLLATLLDPQKGTAVETLAPADLRVTEDGIDAKVTKVEVFNRTVRVEVLIDNGIGMGSNIGPVRTGLRGLLEALPPGVTTSVFTTSPQGRTLVKATKDRDELLKGADRLAPDSNVGRFTESLTEAAERANKEKDTFTVIIIGGTTSGDTTVQSSDVKRLLDQVRGKPMIIHVLMYTAERSESGGGMQIEVGEGVTKMTGGRYESINNLSRWATLLPELGAEVAKQVAGSTRQFRITVQRAGGKSGPLGKLGMSAGAYVVSNVRVEKN